MSDEAEKKDVEGILLEKEPVTFVWTGILTEASERSLGGEYGSSLSAGWVPQRGKESNNRSLCRWRLMAVGLLITSSSAISK